LTTFGDRGGDLNLLSRSAVPPDEPKKRFRGHAVHGVSTRVVRIDHDFGESTACRDSRHRQRLEEDHSGQSPLKWRLV